MPFKLKDQKKKYPKYRRTNQKHQKQLVLKYEAKKPFSLFLLLASLCLVIQAFLISDLTINSEASHKDYSTEDLNYLPLAWPPWPTPRPTATPKPTVTPSPTPSPTPTPTPTHISDLNPTAAPTSTPTSSPSPTPYVTPANTGATNSTPTPSVTPKETLSPSTTVSPYQTRTPVSSEQTETTPQPTSFISPSPSPFSSPSPSTGLAAVLPEQNLEIAVIIVASILTATIVVDFVYFRKSHVLTD
jgi:hypothetical protein